MILAFVLNIFSSLVVFTNCWPEFYLFSRRGLQPSRYVSTDKINSPEYDPFKQTIFVIHGYTVNSNAPNIVIVRDALLANTDSNVIMVDWEEGAASSNFYNPVGYAKAAINGNAVAKDISTFMWLNSIDATRTYCIGHSMGAHVCGFTGQKVPYLWRITGLDPAGPGFDILGSSNKLSPDDAQFVDIIHTSKLEGSLRSLGHADFWPNGGTSKGPCPFLDFSCEHHFAELIFAESTKGLCRFTSVQCDSYDSFEDGECTCDRSACVPMGYYADRNSRGDFYLTTNDQPPYCVYKRRVNKIFRNRS